MARKADNGWSRKDSFDMVKKMTCALEKHGIRNHGSTGASEGTRNSMWKNRAKTHSE